MGLSIDWDDKMMHCEKCGEPAENMFDTGRIRDVEGIGIVCENCFLEFKQTEPRADGFDMIIDDDVIELKIHIPIPLLREIRQHVKNDPVIYVGTNDFILMGIREEIRKARDAGRTVRDKHLEGD